MDARFINPIIDAFRTILPQLGFSDIQRGNIRMGTNSVESLGVTVIIGMTKDIRGNVAYNLSETTAMAIASTMMGGMPVSQFDDLPQSAISELVNMVTANAAIQFEQMGIQVDISPPSLVVGADFRARLLQEKFLVIEMLANGHLLQLNLALETAHS
ncbi:MAG: chemotaxis protein CheX [Negativicutes bacterium]